MEEGELPIDGRIILELSQFDLIDSIIELVTNSEDAYQRSSCSGDIDILWSPVKKGHSAVLGVRDSASGMTVSQLRDAIIFAKRSSGQKVGSKIRGFFGRGLKEAIFSLGEGVIITACSGKTITARIFLRDKRPMFGLDEDPPLRKLHTELSDKTGWSLPSDHGTIILIGTKKDMPVCRESTLITQLENHIELRKILQKTERKVRLIYKDARGSHRTHLIHKVPESVKKIDKEIDLGIPGGKAHLTIFEAKESLDPTRSFGMRYSKAGILVTTENVVLDNRLWDFEYRNAAYYFFGEIDVPLLAELAEKEDFSFLTPHRKGLNWDSQIGKAIKKKCIAELGPLVREKEDELAEPSKPVSDENKAKLRDFCKFLNSLAEEFDVEMEKVGPGGSPTLDGIEQMSIIPPYVKVEPGEVRTLSIYLPKAKAKEENPEIDITLEGMGVSILENKIQLGTVDDTPNTLRGYFRIKGDLLGQIATLNASYFEENAFSTVEVAEKETRGRKPKKRAERAGPFNDIQFDPDPNAIQPVWYDSANGVIKIFVEFPHVKLYIRPNGTFIQAGPGRTMFAELIGKAFCRHLARAGIESGKYPSLMGNQLDNYDRAFNDRRQHAMLMIHQEAGKILAEMRM